MKKTLLAAATLSALMASGMANAAFTDADGSGGWTGNLEFNGAITNTNPVWQYQIPEATIAGAKNWNVERASGTVDGSNTNFSFAKNFTVLEGVMKAPVPNGKAGLQPLVTFGEAGNTVVWDTRDASLATPTPISVAVNTSKRNVGQLNFKLIGQAVNNGNLSSGESAADVVFANVPKAFALLKEQPYYASTYTTTSEFAGPAAIGSPFASTGYMASPSITKLSAALVADALDFVLTFPTASIPDAWTATLPISITVN